MATNFRVKMGEIGRFTFIRRLGILKRSGMSQFQFQNVSSAMIWLQCVKSW